MIQRLWRYESANVGRPATVSARALIGPVLPSFD